MNRDDPRMELLSQMASMVLDARTAGLRRSAERRRILLQQREALDAKSTPCGQDVASARAAYAFETWASARRAEINIDLAANQAEWLSHMDEARRALGRVTALNRLRGKSD